MNGEAARHHETTERPNARSEVLLVSVYELGHQPFALASAWAALEHAGHRVSAIDVSLDALEPALVERADVVAVSVPMHTALRLGRGLIERVRRLNPRAHLCLFGLYAWMHARDLLLAAADSVIGGEFEPALVELAGRVARGERVADWAAIAGVTTAESLRKSAGLVAPPELSKVSFAAPVRQGLPPLERYAKLVGPRPGETRVAGYVEASRGCRYRCRHCPVVPVYDGRFFVVPESIVLSDVDQQVRAGASHITFGDPDFLNGPGHALGIARALHRAHPDVSFDITTKIEHVLAHRQLFSELRELGCVFMLSAVESLSDRVLAELDKGHTKRDVLEALEISRSAGLPLRPSLVPFTPWTTLEDYEKLVDFVFEQGLVEAVEPIQFAIRLLVPRGSALLWPRSGARRPAGSASRQALVTEQPDWLGAYDAGDLGYGWQHPDPRMDALYRAVSAEVERSTQQAPANREVISRIRDLAYGAAGRAPPPLAERWPSAFVPRLTEAWFCCAEPSAAQLSHAGGSLRVQADSDLRASSGGTCVRRC